MRAISIRQPWAWLITSGHKDVENRSWPTSYRGPILIHASKSRVSAEDAEVIRIMAEALHIVIPDHLPTGGIVGVAELVDCITEAEAGDSDWFEGPYGFVMSHACPLPFQTSPGRLGIFEAPDPVG